MPLRPDTLGMTVMLALLAALGPLSTDMYLPSLPAIARELSATTAETQATLSAFLLGFAVGQFAYGPVSDKAGRRPALLAGLGIFLVGSAACAFAPTIATLIAGRFLQAVGAAGPIVLARAMVRDLYEGPRAGRELSRMGMIMGLVPALAPILGGVLQGLFGWRANFWATILCGIGLVLAVLAALPETLPARQVGPLSFAAMLRSFAVLLRHPAYRVYVGLAGLAYGGLFAFISGSSFVLQGVYGLTELGFAFSFAFTVLGYIAGTVLAQKLVGSRGLDGAIAIGVALLAVGGVLMLALVLLRVPSAAAVVGPMALYTAGVGLALPSSQASAMTPFPERAGAASSLLGIVQMSFAALVGIALGHALGGEAWPLPLAVAAAGLAAFTLFRGTRRARVG
ncbi:MAG TPA: multidrug effflux MFS transporter [Beijerinckiaceae bacterium]|jgi:DHA1 family bicyclomycin/chloramphenicol resistance-like MFS transporter